MTRIAQVAPKCLWRPHMMERRLCGRSRKEKIDLRRREEKIKGGGVGVGGRAIMVGATTTWPSREDENTTDKRTLQAVVLADSPSYGNIPRYLWWQATYLPCNIVNLPMDVSWTYNSQNYEKKPTRNLAAYCIYPISKIRYSASSCEVTAHQVDMYGPQGP